MLAEKEEMEFQVVCWREKPVAVCEWPNAFTRQVAKSQEKREVPVVVDPKHHLHLCFVLSAVSQTGWGQCVNKTQT